MSSQRLLPLPALALVTDRRLCQDVPLLDKVSQALAGGVNLVQLREKDPDGRSLPAAELLALAHRLRNLLGGRALLLVNDRLDVALAAGADGVHLPERGFPLLVARRLLGPQAIIGRSVHSLAEAVRAEAEGADYLHVGPIYLTRSHPDAVPAGPELIREVARNVRIPVLAIGGIAPHNVGEAMRAGASGAAVISAILAAPSPREAAAQLWQAIHSAWVDSPRPQARPTPT